MLRGVPVLVRTVARAPSAPYERVECPKCTGQLFRARGAMDVEIRCRCKRLLRVQSPQQVHVISDQ